MTKNEMIEALADFFQVDLPKMENGEYDISREYDWVSGCSMGSGRNWLTLENVVNALSDFCEDE